MREQIYALCSPDGAILDQAVVGFAEATGSPQRGIALYTKEASPITHRDLEAHGDLGAQVRPVTYDEVYEALMRLGRIPPPRVAINGHIFTQAAFMMWLQRLVAGCCGKRSPAGWALSLVRILRG